MSDTPQDTPTPETPDTPAPDAPDTPETPAWSYADGVAGEGDAPEWFKGDKYGSIAAQAEAYTHLEGKFGSFTGAPDEYAITLREEITEKGIEFAADDPLIEKAMEYAKEAGMNQEGFEGMLNLYAMGKLAEQEAYEKDNADYIAAEMKALGQNAQGRIDNIKKWAAANMDEENLAGLNDITQSAAAVKALEQLISMSRAAPINPDGSPAPGSITEAELKEMQFAKDEHGNRKIQTDPAFKAEYDKKMEQFYGTGDHKIVVRG